MPALLGSATQPAHAYLYWEFYEGGSAQAVRMGRFKVLRKPMVHGACELYDLATDVGERHDLARFLPDVVQRAKRVMTRARASSPVWKVPQPKSK